MQKKEFSGKTLDDALAEAGRSLGVDPSKVQYDVVSSGGAGLFARLFSKGVKIEAWVAQGKDDLEAAAREAVLAAIKGSSAGAARAGEMRRDGSGALAGEASRPGQQGSGGRKDSQARPQQQGRGAENRGASQQQQVQGRARGDAQPNRVAREGGESRTPREAQAQQDGRRPQQARQGGQPRPPREQREPTEAREPKPAGRSLEEAPVRAVFDGFLAEFLRGYAIDPASASVTSPEPGSLRVYLQDAWMEENLGKSDRLSTAFEHVFKRLAQKTVGDVEGRVSLDAGDAQAQREERLKEMALSMADKVKKSGKSVTLASRSSQERRVIHLSLDGMTGVATRSVGVGENRKLIIYSTDKPERANGEGRRDRGEGRRRGGGGGNRKGAESALVRPDPQDPIQLAMAAKPVSPLGAAKEKEQRAEGNKRRRSRRGGRNRSGGGGSGGGSAAGGGSSGTASSDQGGTTETMAARTVDDLS